MTTTTTRKTASRRTKHALAAAWLSASALGAPGEPAGVADLVARGEALTTDSVALLRDGELVYRRVPLPDDLAPLPAPPADWPAPRTQPIGVTIATLDPSQGPFEVLPMPGATARVLLGGADGLIEARSGQRILDGRVSTLAADASGARVLVVRNESPEVLVLDSADLAPLARYSPPNRDLRVAAWRTADSLLLQREIIDWQAGTERRIYVLPTLLPLETLAEESPAWDAARFAALGTLPEADLQWAHLRLDYQIDPDPAPLLEVEDGRVLEPLTRTLDGIDLSPAATGSTLFWIRKPRRGVDTGTLMGRDLAADGPERTLCAWPVAALGASQGQVAYIAGFPAKDAATLFLADAAALSAATDGLGARDAFFRDRWGRIVPLLDAALEEAAPPGLVERQARQWRLAALPEPALMDSLGALLDASLDSAFRATLPQEARGLPALELLDAALAGAPRLGRDQSPALFLAITGLVVREARARADATLLWPAETPGIDLAGDDAAAGGYALANPAALAADALRGKRGLAPTVAAWAAGEQPLFLVPDGSRETRAAVRRFLAGAAGLATDNPSPAQLRSALERFPSNTFLLREAARRGGWEGEPALALAAAATLCQANPADASAFALLAENLNLAARFPEALAAAEWALRLDPDNAAHGAQFAEALLGLHRLPEARDAFLRCRRLRGGAQMEELVERRLALIGRLLEEKP
ncbi:MAG: hypothetical protein SF028_03230 [Candidatus Sumerlaeia bacterium]|nr:hypothetical protein [Candidatus Sumerlaeia bacterium]